METRHLKTGVAKDNPAPVVPDTVLAKLVAAFEAKLQRGKEMKLIPLVPKKPSVELTRRASTNNMRRPSVLSLGSQSHVPTSRPVTPSSRPATPSSRPGTPSSQKSDPPAQRQPNKLRKRSRSFTRSFPELETQDLPVQLSPSPAAQVQAVFTKVGDREKSSGSEVLFKKQVDRVKLGPPPSPSHGRRFEGESPVKRRPKKRMGPPPPSPPRRTTPAPKDQWEVV